MASVRETISGIVDQWFLYEPLLFNVYCTHKLEENKTLCCPFRTGQRRIEYNPELLKDCTAMEIEKGLKNEITRILLKHPYQRVPQNPNRAALKTASDVTISEHCYVDKNLHDAHYYDLENGLSYEEYYKKLYYICPDYAPQMPQSGGGEGAENGQGNDQPDEYQAAAQSSELWAEDEEAADAVNQQIQKAAKSNQWGSVTGTFQETITASLKIPMDYRRILSQFRASIISQRRLLTRMKPNRRYEFDYMGSKFEPKTHLLVAVDVSGSIATEDLKNFFSIINRFFAYGVEVINVIAFDTQIQQEFELKKATKKINITGRGGTDFQCVMDYYAEHPEYQGLIVFTDGYAEVPVLKTNKQLLWVLTGKREYDYAIQWIKTLKQSKATWIPSVKKNGAE